MVAPAPDSRFDVSGDTDLVSDQRLPGGWMSGSRLVDGTVRRPLGPHSESIHRVLRHLEMVGFDGAPRVLGIDGNDEVLTYIVGHVPVEEPRDVHPVVFSEMGIGSAFRLIRRLHDITDGGALAGTGRVICHGDLSPWNTVYDPAGAVALIDWDDARPGRREDDLGYAVWRHLRLGLPDAPSLADQRRQLRIAAASYGGWDPAGLIELVREAQERHRHHFEQRRSDGDPRYLRLIELGALNFINRAQQWLDHHAEELT